MRKLFFSFLLTTLLFSVNAQDGITEHFLRNNFYANDVNPSTTTPYEGHIGFPFLNNFNASLTNTSLHYNKLFGFAEDGRITSIKLKDVTDHLSPKYNDINTNLSLNILDFSTQTKALNFSFAYRLRCDEYLSFSKDIFGLFAYGNMHYAGEENMAHFNGMLNLNAYQEFAFGFQFKIKDKISVGIRPKLLFGIANIRTTSASADIYTDPDDYSLRIKYLVDASLMSIVPISIDTNNKMSADLQSFNAKDIFRNAGASIDLGATYTINEKFGISASILDLGFICWKTNGLQFNGTIDSTRTLTDNGSFIFNGLSADNINQLKEDPSAFKDTILSYFPMSHQSIDKYTKALAGHFMVEGYYNFKENQRVSVLFHGRLIQKHFIPSLTIAWDANFGKIFDLCVNYTMTRKSYANFGLGFGLNFGPFHIFAATDNIFGFFNTKSIPRSLLNTSNANVRLGMFFTFAKSEKERLQ